MNKKEVAVQIANKTGLTLREAARLIDAFHEVVQEELAAGGKVQLKGFGSRTCLPVTAWKGIGSIQRKALWKPK